MRTALKNIFHRATRHSLSARTPPIARRRQLCAEHLEARRLLAADASVNITGASQSLLGEEVNFVVTFDNASNDPTDNVGYSPFVDIVMPATGDAPPLPENGISFSSGSATYNGMNLQTTVITFDANGEATHPFAKDSAGQPLVIQGTAGDELVVVELPFGSYGPSQPPIDINFQGQISPLAQPTRSYDVTATGGYRYQLDASGNPTVDQADFGTTATDPVQPQLFRLKKTSNTPEHETATGPNFKHSYTVSMAVAKDQTVENLTLKDELPAEVQFVSVTSMTGNQSNTQTQILPGPSTTTPGGVLEYEFDQVIGTGNNGDVQLVFEYYVTQQDQNGQPVIPLNTGGTKLITNKSSASGTWTSSNPNFLTPQSVSSSNSPDTEYNLTARTVSLQKSFSKVGGGTTYKAGDTIEYRLNFQVSDYFALNNVTLEDILSDGQEIDASFTPTISFQQQANGNNFTNQPFAGPNVTSTINGDGTQTVVFDISEQLKALRLLPDGRMLGAAIPFQGTAGVTPDPNTTVTPGTTGTVIFRANILDDYRTDPFPGAEVVEGDVMTDTASMTADVLAYSDALTDTGSTVIDASQKSFTLANGGSTKE
ncbi:MAG TPA: hypothetical protein DD662_02415, partial [Planctomycetaceae bacterium]|nr:hypothetical protein [Planctomycetaceae bacterium]